MSSKQIGDALRNSDKAVESGSNSYSANSDSHIMSPSEAKQIDKADSRDSEYNEAKARANDEAVKKALKDRSLMRKLVDEPLKNKKASTTPGNMSADNIASHVLQKKKVNMTWETLLEDLFSTIRPSTKTYRHQNQHQISTYRAVRRITGSSHTIIPMRSANSVTSVGAVWILVDTSGSMWSYLSSSMTMIGSLANELIEGLAGLVIIPIDTEIKDIQVWETDAIDELKTAYESDTKDGTPINFTGGGGTQFDNAIKFLDEFAYEKDPDEDEISWKFLNGKKLDDITRVYNADNIAEGGEQVDDAFDLLESMPPCATLLLTDTDVLYGAVTPSTFKGLSNMEHDSFFTFILGTNQGHALSFGQTILVPDIDGDIKIIGKYGNEIPSEEL